MATDNGRIKAALKSIDAVEFDGAEKDAALSALRKLDGAEGRRRGASLRPGFLSSEAEYLDAPDGTVVHKKFGDGFWVKDGSGWWDEKGVFCAVGVIAGAERRVTKWGDL